MKIKASLQIAKSSDGLFRIRIQDEASRQQIVEVVVEPADFACCLTGLFLSDLNAETGNLAVVGKTKITERRTIECPLSGYDRKKFEQWLIDNAQEDGWSLDPYLRSQGSISGKGDKTILNYSVFKYV